MWETRICCTELLYRNSMPACCRCNGSGRCVRCACRRSGRPCTTCLPSRNGRCSNNTNCLTPPAPPPPAAQAPVPEAPSSAESVVPPPLCQSRESLSGSLFDELATMDLADATTGGLPSEPGDFLNELNGLLMADNGQPEAEPEAPALPQFEPMLTANAAWHNLSGEEFASAIDSAYDQIVHWKSNLFKVATVRSIWQKICWRTCPSLLGLCFGIHA